MGRIVVAEEKILPEFVRLGKTDGYIPGLIIGQCSGQKDFIVHLAKTPLPAEKVKKSGNDVSGDSRKFQKKCVENLNEVQESWLIDHAKQVTRMLPGGIWVLGVFVTGPGDVFNDSTSQTKIASLLRALSKALDTNPYLFGNSPSPEKICLHLVGGTSKFFCKSYDVTSTSSQFRPADCKFTSNLKWHQLDSQYDFDLHPPYLVTNKLEPVEVHFQEILHVVDQGLQKSLCTIDGEIRNGDEALEVTDTNRSSKGEPKPDENKVFRVNLYIPSDTESANLSVPSIAAEMKCMGVLASRVFVHQKATVAEAFKAVKEDITRSFAARVEMHWDSLMEEEIRAPEEMTVVHEPPRRVLIPLPHSHVALSDYLFPGEGPMEALSSVLDLIGIQVSEAAVYEDFEGQPDPAELYNMTNPDTQKGESSSNSSSSHSFLLFSGIAVAFFILMVSLFIQFYIK